MRDSVSTLHRSKLLDIAVTGSGGLTDVYHWSDSQLWQGTEHRVAVIPGRSQSVVTFGPARSARRRDATSVQFSC
jgi:hypothetical protein